MTSFRRIRKQRTLVAFMLGALGLVALPLLGYTAFQLISTSQEGDFVRVICRQPIPSTPALLIGVVDEEKSLSAAALFTMKPHRDGVWAGGTIVSVPPSSRVTFDDGTVGSFSDSTVANDPLAFGDAFLSLTAVSPTASLIVNAQQFGELFQPVGDVALPAQVMQLLADPATTQPIPSAGDVVVLPAQLGALFARVRAVADPLVEVELADTLWRSVSAKVGAGLRFPGYQPSVVTPPTAPPASDGDCPGQAARVPEPRDAAEFIASMMGGPVGTYRIAASAVEGESDLVKLDIVESKFLMSRLAPSLISPALSGPTVYLVSSLSDDTTKEVIARLDFLQLNIVLRSQPNAVPPDVTTLAFEEESLRRNLEGAVSNIGAYQVVKPTAAFEGVDVVITLGRSVDQMLANPSATVPTAPPATEEEA